MRVLCLLFVLQTLAFLLVKSEGTPNDEIVLKEKVQTMQKTIEDITTRNQKVESQNHQAQLDVEYSEGEEEEIRRGSHVNGHKLSQLEKKIKVLEEQSKTACDCDKEDKKFSEFLKELGTLVTASSTTQR